MGFWGKLILAVDTAAIFFLARSLYRFFRTVKKAGQRIQHIYPSKSMVLGTFGINIFGIITTLYAFFNSSMLIYLLLAAVFIVNIFTVFHRIVSLHENGMIVYGRLAQYIQMKKVIWGKEHKRFVEMRIEMKDKDALPVFLSIPIKHKESIHQILRKKIVK